MGRRRFEVGEHGTITRTKLPDGKVVARCRVKCRDGKLRAVEASATSGAKAEMLVKKRAAQTAQDCGKRSPGSSPQITPASSVKELADEWMERRRKTASVQESTLNEDQRYVNIIGDGIGRLRVREVDPGTCEWFVTNTAGAAPGKAKNLKRVLLGMYELAITLNAYDGHNPARATTVPASTRDKPRALTVDDLAAYREHMRLWAATPATAGRSNKKGGRPRAQGLMDYVDVQLGTGARISEVLAIRWQDIDFEASPVTVTICGQVDRRPGKKSAGGGLYRKDHLKNGDDYRTVSMPSWAVATLLRLKVSAVPNAHDVVFPSERGTLRDRHNVHRQFRDAHDKTPWEWVTPHSFRKAVATIVARESSIEAASAQLGHSATGVTVKHYVERGIDAPDVSGVLEQLGPRAAESRTYPALSKRTHTRIRRCPGTDRVVSGASSRPVSGGGRCGAGRFTDQPVHRRP